MEFVKQYFSTLNLSVLPDKASSYISDEIITDDDFALIDENDEDFLEIKNLIEQSYPKALPKSAESESDSTSTDEQKEWKDAMETLNMLIEMGGEEKEIAEWKEAVETLNMLM